MHERHIRHLLTFLPIPCHSWLLYPHNRCVRFATKDTKNILGGHTPILVYEPVIFGSVALYQGGVLITGGETNFDGRYTIELEPGLYQLESTYIGLESQRIDEVMVHKGEMNLLDLHMDIVQQ